jgi:hypothetical protein
LSAKPFVSKEASFENVASIVGELVVQLPLSEELREALNDANGDGEVLLKSAVIEGVPLPRATAGPAGSAAPAGSLHTASCAEETAGHAM